MNYFIDSKTKEVFFNEVNPMPGDLYEHNWRAAGVSSVELVRKLVDFGIQRHENKKQRTTSFNTNYLKQF